MVDVKAFVDLGVEFCEARVDSGAEEALVGVFVVVFYYAPAVALGAVHELIH
jgi:hypothetical protein